jgi:hypothetical protein
MRWVVAPCSSSNGLSHNSSVDVTPRHWSGPRKTAECSPDTSLHHLRKRFPSFVRCLLWCRVGGGANLKARLRPPLKPDVRFSRIRLSQGCFCSEVSRKESAKPGSPAPFHHTASFPVRFSNQCIATVCDDATRDAVQSIDQDGGRSCGHELWQSTGPIRG